MRARTVNEDLDFERGQDIRKSVGGIALWFKNFDKNFFTLKGWDHEQGSERDEAKEKLKKTLLSLPIKEIPYKASNLKSWGILGNRDSNRSFELDHGIIITADECISSGEAVIFMDGRKYDLGDTSNTSTWREAIKAVFKELQGMYKREKYCEDDYDPYKEES